MTDRAEGLEEGEAHPTTELPHVGKGQPPLGVGLSVDPSGGELSFRPKARGSSSAGVLGREEGGIAHSRAQGTVSENTAGAGVLV